MSYAESDRLNPSPRPRPPALIRRGRTIFLIGLALAGAACQPINHFILHPRHVPPSVYAWSEETSRGQLVLRLEWAKPEGRGPFPAVLIHPEAGRTANDLKGAAFDLARAGYLAAAVDYRRVVNDQTEETFFPWRDESEVSAALDVLRARPEVDPARIGLLGFSLGGFESLWIAARAGAGVKAVVAYYPPTDFSYWLDAARGEGGWERFMRGQVRAYFRSGAGTVTDDEFEGLVRMYSVLDRAEAIRASVLLIHGDQDATVSIEESRRLKARLDALGRPAELLVVPGAVHVFNFKNASQAAFAWEATLRWLNEAMPPVFRLENRMSYLLHEMKMIRLTGTDPVPAAFGRAESLHARGKADYEAGRYRPAAEAFWEAAVALRLADGEPYAGAFRENRVSLYKNAFWAWLMAEDRDEAGRALAAAVREDPDCAAELKEFAAEYLTP